MLNLDTEEWGEICIGCAGGGDTSIELDVPCSPAPHDLTPYMVSSTQDEYGLSGIIPRALMVTYSLAMGSYFRHVHTHQGLRFNPPIAMLPDRSLS